MRLPIIAFMGLITCGITVPGAEFHVVPAGSHWVMYDAAESFNRVLLDVLMR